jgi:hypothetical protein
MVTVDRSHDSSIRFLRRVGIFAASGDCYANGSANTRADDRALAVTEFFPDDSAYRTTDPAADRRFNFLIRADELSRPSER